MDETIDIVWFRRNTAQFPVPQWMRAVSPMSCDNSIWGILKAVYEMATAKVWISSSGVPKGCKKRKGQLYAETYHGGYGFVSQRDIGDDFDKVNDYA